MGIYIPGMEMPPRGKVNLLVMFDDGTVQDNSDGQNQWRAIELPPHGRLGDLDALERNLREMADYQHGDRQQGILGCCSTICSADTIIPADPEKEDDLK